MSLFNLFPTFIVIYIMRWRSLLYLTDIKWGHSSLAASVRKAFQWMSRWRPETVELNGPAKYRCSRLICVTTNSPRSWKHFTLRPITWPCQMFVDSISNEFNQQVEHCSWVVYLTRYYKLNNIIELHKLNGCGSQWIVICIWNNL